MISEGRGGFGSKEREVGGGTAGRDFAISRHRHSATGHDRIGADEEQTVTCSKT